MLSISKGNWSYFQLVVRLILGRMLHHGLRLGVSHQVVFLMVNLDMFAVIDPVDMVVVHPGPRFAKPQLALREPRIQCGSHQMGHRFHLDRLQVM